MKRVILDTDVVIDFLRQGRGLLDEVVEAADEGRVEVYVSAATVLELWAGESSKKQEALIRDTLVGVSVVPLGNEITELAGSLKRGHKLQLPMADLIIGATAVWIKGELVTKNKRDFSQVPGIKFWKGDRILE